MRDDDALFALPYFTSPRTYHCFAVMWDHRCLIVAPCDIGARVGLAFACALGGSWPCFFMCFDDGGLARNLREGDIVRNGKTLRSLRHDDTGRIRQLRE